MISDEQMDARLNEAGAQWRAANAGAYAGDTIPAETTVLVTEPSRTPARPRWALLVSAAAVVALLAGGGLWFANRSGSRDRSAAGPGPTTATTHGGLTGTHWQIFDVTRDSTFSADGLDASTSTAYLTLPVPGVVTGSDGCNTFSGTSVITDSSIKFDSLAFTAMGCLDQRVGKIADTIDAVLSGTVSWHIQTSGDGMFLSIEHSGVGSLIYTATAPPVPPIDDPSKMAGSWQLYETDHTSGDSGSASGSGASSGFVQYLVIAADGSFKVQHRCYANSGTATIGKGTADFGQTHLDGAIPCPSLLPSEMQDEQAQDTLVDNTLSGPTTWTIENGRLHITKGADTLVYAPLASDLPSGASTS